MTIVALVPLIVALVGGLGYMISSNSKVQECGRIMFAAGLFAFCFSMTSSQVHIGHMMP